MGRQRPRPTTNISQPVDNSSAASALIQFILMPFSRPPPSNKKFISIRCAPLPFKFERFCSAGPADGGVLTCSAGASLFLLICRSRTKLRRQKCAQLISCAHLYWIHTRTRTESQRRCGCTRPDYKSVRWLANAATVPAAGGPFFAGCTC